MMGSMQSTQSKFGAASAYSKEKLDLDHKIKVVNIVIKAKHAFLRLIDKNKNRYMRAGRGFTVNKVMKEIHEEWLSKER